MGLNEIPPTCPQCDLLLKTRQDCYTVSVQVPGALPSGVKRPGREADVALSCAEVKNECSCASTPSQVLMACPLTALPSLADRAIT